MISDYKTIIINLSSFGISMTNIDVALKILLVSVTIGYTIQKWYLLNENKNKKVKPIVKPIVKPKPKKRK